MSDAIAIRNGKFARLNERPVFFFTETRTITFDFPQGYSYSQDDEYELSLDVDADVDTGPMLRVFGSVDTENRKVTFVLPFYGDEVKGRINGRDSSVMLVIQLARVSNTTGVRHILLHDTVLCIPAVDDGGDGSEVLPDAEQQPANAHYTVQELDDLLATAPLFQFSEDGEEWHDEQTADDVFIRFSNAETREVHWSGPIRFMPADFAEYVAAVRAAAMTATEKATLAESWAVGNTNTRTGEDTDNSKYYSEQSAAQASNASNSASTATAKATLAESYAKGGTGTRSGEDADNAKYYKEQASTSAQSADANAVLAESYAKGGTNTRTGEDTDNAKYYNEGAEDAKGGALNAKALAETAQSAAESAAGNASAATGAAITAQFAEALSKVAGQVASAQAAANSASASQVSAAGNAANSNVWAEGTDAQVEALGGEHSAKRWAEIGGGGGSWGSITGDIADQTDLQAKFEYYIPQTEKGAANGVAGLDANGMVPVAELPLAKDNAYGAIKGGVEGVAISGSKLGTPYIVKATNEQIDSVAKSRYNPIVPDNLDYAVRSVLPNVTVIPAATTAYTLLGASATTNNHSCTYTHAPTSAPTYTLPAVTDATVAHHILLYVDYTTVQTSSFVDSNNVSIVPLDNPTISAGDVVEYLCMYDPLQAKWVISCGKLNA